MTAQPTYHGKDFRTYPPQTDLHDGEYVTTKLCEERDPESGRWEPFISIVSRIPA